MFLHVGADTILLKKNIVAILNYKAAGSSINRDFLSNAASEGLVKIITEPGKEKSLLITDEEIFISPISSSTLKKRSMQEYELVPDLAR